MNVTYLADDGVRSLPFGALQFPLHIFGDKVSSGSPAPALRLLRSDGCATGTAADITVTSSSRTVELHVQAVGDFGLSYAQTFRGTPCSSPVVSDSVISARFSVDASPQTSSAFLIRIPVRQVYPDWRAMQLRFASARATAGPTTAVAGDGSTSTSTCSNTSCLVYDVQLLSPEPAAQARDSVGTGQCQQQTQSQAIQVPGAKDEQRSGGRPSAAPDTAEAAPTLAAVREVAVTTQPSAPTEDDPSVSPAATAGASAAAAATGAEPAAVATAGAGSGAGAGVGVQAAIGTCGTAGTTQMQQLRELLQRAAANVPASLPHTGSGTTTTAAVAGAAAGAGQLDAGAPSGPAAAGAFPSAAKANLGLAATLARSLLQAQGRMPTHPPAPALAAFPTAPDPYTQPQAQFHSLLSLFGAATASCGGGTLGAGTAPLPPTPSPEAVAAAQLAQQQQQRHPHYQQGPAEARNDGPMATAGLPLPTQQQQQPAAAFPGPGLMPLSLPGALAVAASQLADISARVQRIEQLLLWGPTEQHVGGSGQQQGLGQGQQQGMGQGQQQGQGQGQQQGHRQQQREQQGQGPQEQGQQEQMQGHQQVSVPLPSWKEGHQQQPPPSQRRKPQHEQGTCQQQSREEVPGHLLVPLDDQGRGRSLVPEQGQPPLVPEQGQPLAEAAQQQLQDQVLALLPSLVSAVGRLEAAVGRQGAQLARLEQQMTEVRCRIDAVAEAVTVVGPTGAAVEQS